MMAGKPRESLQAAVFRTMARRVKIPKDDTGRTREISSSLYAQTSPKKARLYDLYPSSAGLLPSGTPSEGKITSPKYKRKLSSRSPLKSTQAKSSRIPVYRNKKKLNVSSRVQELSQSAASKSQFAEFDIGNRITDISTKSSGFSKRKFAGKSRERSDHRNLYESHITKTYTSTPRHGPPQSSQHKESRLPVGIDNWRNGSSFERSNIKGKGIGKGGAKRVARLQKKNSVPSFVGKTTSIGIKPPPSMAAAVSPPLPPLSKSKGTRSSKRRSTVNLLTNGFSESQSRIIVQDQEESCVLGLEDLEPMVSESSSDEEAEEDECEIENSSEGNQANSNERKDAVFGLSRSLLRNLFCLYSKKRVTRGAMDLVLQFTDAHLRQLSEDMVACAEKAGRRMITTDDVIVLLRQQHSIESQQEWVTLVHSLLPMDYAQILVPCTLIRK